MLATGGSLTSAITFSLNFPESNPEHYMIAVDANGHAHYECTSRMTADAEPETYKSEFEMSIGDRQRIFDLAKQAKYFSGKVDSGNHKLAFTGHKTLSYQDGDHTITVDYNYSSHEPVQQLTELFQNIATALEYGHRLTYYHRFQKLALDDELKRMEAQARNNQLSEIQAVTPILREIENDSSVINSVRARARELIEMGAVSH
jgi:hypothetical protein